MNCAGFCSLDGAAFPSNKDVLVFELDILADVLGAPHILLSTFFYS